MNERSRLKHPEWVLFHRQGVSFAKIAELNGVTAAEVRVYIAGIRRRHPELLAGRLMLHDRPRPKPASWIESDPDRRFRARLQEYLAFMAEHGRRPSAGIPEEFSIAHWLTSIRSDNRRGEVSEVRVRILDRQIPDWRTPTRDL